MTKISAMAREAFWDYAQQARSRGRDLAEVLDREGYLLTEQRLLNIQADTIREIADLLATTSPHQWTRMTTQKDLQDAIAAALRKAADERRK